jgi:hypothetical protein
MLSQSDDILADEDEEERRLAEVSALLVGLSTAVVAVICRRLKVAFDEKYTYVDARIAQLDDIAEIKSIIAKAQADIVAESASVLKGVADTVDATASQYYEARRLTQVAWVDNPQVGKAVTSQIKATEDEIRATVTYDSARLRVIRSGKAAYTTLSEAYQSAVDTAVRAVSSGESDLTKALSSTVDNLGGDGLRVAVSDGSTREMYSAVRTSVTGGYRKTIASAREQQAKQFGADGVEISAHALCAPDHVEAQGRQMTIKKYEELNSSLARPIYGINCKHTVRYIVLGTSPSAYTDAQLEQIKTASNKTVTWTGMSGAKMSGSAYDATQYQRKVEAASRKQYQKTEAYKAAGMTDEASASEKARTATTAYYRTLSSSLGISTQTQRLKS